MASLGSEELGCYSSTIIYCLTSQAEGLTNPVNVVTAKSYTGSICRLCYMYMLEVVNYIYENPLCEQFHQSSLTDNMQDMTSYMYMYLPVKTVGTFCAADLHIISRLRSQSSPPREWLFGI